MTVLFVDPDLPAARYLASTMDERYAVALVRSASEAWAAIRARVPDLIVTELDLPDGSGVDLISSVRNAASTRHTLLMALTQRASLADKVAALQAGADDFLSKPIDSGSFQTHLDQISHFRKTLH
jgi:DNA-binding response OmpR family regulator